MTQREKFIQMVAPYAQKYAPMVNLPPSVVIAQLGVESADGTSNPARGYNNFGGIMYTKYADFQGKKSTQGTYFSGYNSVDSFFRDYVRVMSLDLYKGVRDAGSVEATVRALAASPYDAGHYGGSGNGILDYINTAGLRKYDNVNPSGGSIGNVDVTPGDIKLIPGVPGIVLVAGASAIALAALVGNSRK